MSTYLDHVALNVKDISRSIEWYIQNLGALILYQDETWAMLQCKDIKIALTMSTQHPPHVAFRIQELSKFPSARKIKMHRDGSQYYYQSDPDGNMIEWIHYPSDKVSENL